MSGVGGGSGGAGEDERELEDCLFGFGDWERVVVRMLLNQDAEPPPPPVEELMVLVVVVVFVVVCSGPCSLGRIWS